jgi:hypothetical protein
MEPPQEHLWWQELEGGWGGDNLAEWEWRIHRHFYHPAMNQWHGFSQANRRWSESLSLDKTPWIISQRPKAKAARGKPAFSTSWEVPGLTFDEAFWRGFGSQQQHPGVRIFGR